MIRVESLVKHYGDILAVDQLNMHVRPGDVHGFLGANGSGKTTSIKCIIGLLRPDQGSIFIQDINIAEQPVQAKHKFGYLPENQFLYPEMTADEYIRFIGRLRGTPDREVADHADRFLTAFGLEESRHSFIGSYSMGMKKKTALAGTLVGDPEIIILDEPTSGLDPPSMYLFKEIIRELKKRGRTVLIASHNLPFIEDLADQFTIIDHGKIIADGTLDELRQQVQQPEATLEDLFIQLSGRRITDLNALFEKKTDS